MRPTRLCGCPWPACCGLPGRAGGLGVAGLGALVEPQSHGAAVWLPLVGQAESGGEVGGWVLPAGPDFDGPDPLGAAFAVFEDGEGDAGAVQLPGCGGGS